MSMMLCLGLPYSPVGSLAAPFSRVIRHLDVYALFSRSVWRSGGVYKQVTRTNPDPRLIAPRVAPEVFVAASGGTEVFVHPKLDVCSVLALDVHR